MTISGHSSDPPVKLGREAMNTRFEIVLHGNNPAALRGAGEEVLNEIERLEGLLSLFRASSEVAKVNARAGGEPVRVSPEVFGLLQHAKGLWEETGGAFDITVGPLMRCWGLHSGRGRVPSPAELETAREVTGMHLVELDPEGLTVRFSRAGVMLDLGAIGKGYAIEQGVALLRESGVTSALLHGGTSTVYGLGAPPEQATWKVAVDHPPQSPAQGKPLTVIDLKDSAVSVSAVWGKYFKVGGQNYGHVLDPRRGAPVSQAVLSIVAVESATESDALSTALLAAGLAGQDAIGRLRSGMRTLVMEPKEDNHFVCEARGLTLEGTDS